MKIKVKVFWDVMQCSDTNILEDLVTSIFREIQPYMNRYL